MLCRALIAAIVVTCTLSQGQATQRLDQIKGMLCVLLLSGIQKEDLDVSMLMKLQRHNVNIDDMNNEELLQACVQSRANNNKKNIFNVTESQPYLTNKKNAVLKEFKTNAAFDISKTPRTVEYDLTSVSTNYKSRRDNRATNNAHQNKSNLELKLKHYNDKQPNLASVLEFWKNTKMNKEMKDLVIQKPDKAKDQENKRSISEIIHSSETDNLKRLLADIFEKSKNLSTKLTTTEKTVNVEDEFGKLYPLRIQGMDKNTNVNSGLELSLSNLPIQKYSRRTPIENIITEKILGIKKEEPIIMKLSNLTDTLTLRNTFKSFNPVSDAEVINNIKKKTKESLTLSRNPYLNSYPKFDTSPSNKEAKQEISRDMIKEIAVSVKELILRDLRKELYETTTTTSTSIKSTATIQRKTTRETEFQTILKKENTKTPDSVMIKFIEFFEELKSLKQNNVLSKNEKEINNKEVIDKKKLTIHHQETRPPVISNKIIPAKLPFYANQGHRITIYPPENSENVFNFAPQIHKYRSNGTTFKQSTIIKQPKVVKPPTIIKQEPNNGLLPLTVQTNNIEILPLGIPVDKPQNLIRENIIVTTMAPYRIVPISNGKRGPFKNVNQHRGERVNIEASKNYEMYKPKNTNPHLSKEPHRTPQHNFYSNDNDDIIRFTLNNNEHSKYNTDYYEKINIGKYKPISGELLHREIPRFHEKLERYLDYSDQNKYTDKHDCCNQEFGYSNTMVDCCNRKIASRQQMSLNMKKNSYDDIHFKKFLQSQQKVTDMLERILGDKGNVHSVETA